MSAERLRLLACPTDLGAAVHQRIWDVVCIAALHAMEHGRRRAAGMRAREPHAADGRVVAFAAAAAVAAFWGGLASFVAQKALPKGWATAVPSDHVFIGWVAEDGTHSLVLRRPV